MARPNRLNREAALRDRLASAAAIVLALATLSVRLGNAETFARQDPSSEIRVRLESPGDLIVEVLPLDRPSLERVYSTRSFEPVWIGRPSLEAALADALATVQEDGIDPEISGVGAVSAALADPKVPTTDRELLFSDRYLAAARLLAQGSIAPADIEADWALPRPSFDPAAALARLAERGDPSSALASLAPASRQYRALKAALARYRALAAAGGWQALPADTPIKPGAAGPPVRELRARLAAEGDLTGETGASDVYDATVAAAVGRYQSRHGIAVDGRVGAATFRALNVGAAGRVEQIRLNLERLRAMQHDWPATRIEVNVAAAALTFYRDGEPALTSPVIVGDPKHPTPVLTARADAILLNPPWNVPTSIVRKEIQPKLRRASDYLARNHFILLGRDEGDPQGRDIDWRRTTILGQGWRLQQEPGPWNSLGRIKLELPNPFDVYLHDTPAKSLFAKSARALSHGCVRVDAVHRLAEALLGAAWPAETIDQAISAGDTLRIPLLASVPVYLLYLTAFVADDGAVEFRDDIYGRDARLAAALARLKSGQEANRPAISLTSAGCQVG